MKNKRRSANQEQYRAMTPSLERFFKQQKKKSLQSHLSALKDELLFVKLAPSKKGTRVSRPNPPNLVFVPSNRQESQVRSPILVPQRIQYCHTARYLPPYLHG